MAFSVEASCTRDPVYIRGLFGAVRKPHLPVGLGENPTEHAKLIPVGHSDLLCSSRFLCQSTGGAAHIPNRSAVVRKLCRQFRSGGRRSIYGIR